MWPVILRELKASARHRGIYYLRMLAAGVALGTAVWLSVMRSSNFRVANDEGAELFGGLHQMLLITIGIIVPLMTMDCISREKREGTLGLLFLTNLKSTHIVFAKLAAHGLRAVTLWLAVIPVMALPLLMGGVDWHQVALSSLFAFECVVLSLLVGVTVSALSRGWLSGLVLTILLGVGAAATLVIGNAFAMMVGFEVVNYDPGDRYHGYSVGVASTEGWDWIFSAGLPGNAKLGFLIGIALFVLMLAVFAFIVVLAVSAYVRRSWQDKPKSRRQQQVENTFYKPVVALGLLRRWMRTSLQRNPIGWLERRSWTGRIAGWVWLGVIISFASAFATYHQLMEDLFYGIMWLLLASLAYVAAASFRRERETGALELILVTPLTEWKIVWGRLWGVWGIFLPSFVLWILVLIYSFSWLKQWEPSRIVSFTVTFMVLPIVGLYFSLRSRFVLLAWLGTMLVGVLVPKLAWMVAYVILRLLLPMFAGRFEAGYGLLIEEYWPWIQMTAQLSIAAFLLWRLHLLLVRRTFSFRIA